MSDAEGEAEEPKNFAKKEMILEKLGKIDRSACGTTFAYTELNLSEKEL